MNLFSIEQVFIKDLKNENNIDRLLKLSFEANGNSSAIKTVSLKYFWNETFYNLDRTKIWQSLNVDEKNHILKRMSDHLLREAFYIENAGMIYAAKMNILAESIEERSFYSVMGFEESKHLQSLSPFFSEDIKLANIPSFSNLIGKIICEGDKASNLFLIQILLEGWGLSYYQSLHDQNLDSDMRIAFAQILKDETRHHSAGVILLDKNKLKESSFVETAFVELMELVKIGPWTLVKEILDLNKNFSKNDIHNFLIELNAISETEQKIQRLKQLTEKSLSSDLLSKFDKTNFWKPYTLDQMVSSHSL